MPWPAPWLKIWAKSRLRNKKGPASLTQVPNYWSSGWLRRETASTAHVNKGFSSFLYSWSRATRAGFTLSLPQEAKPTNRGTNMSPSRCKPAAEAPTSHTRVRQARPQTGSSGRSLLCLLGTQRIQMTVFHPEPALMKWNSGTCRMLCALPPTHHQARHICKLMLLFPRLWILEILQISFSQNIELQYKKKFKKF